MSHFGDERKTKSEEGKGKNIRSEELFHICKPTNSLFSEASANPKMLTNGSVLVVLEKKEVTDNKSNGYHYVTNNACSLKTPRYGCGSEIWCLHIKVSKIKHSKNVGHPEKAIFYDYPRHSLIYNNL